jgi:ABC-type branched-subunit amino acid transport system ATPase component
VATQARNRTEGAPPLARETLLKVRDLDVSYGNVQVLFGAEFDVYAGEALVLLGTNGAGKSTLLKTISGLLRPTRGTVEFDGADITDASPDARFSAGLVQLSGGNAVFPTLSIEENLRLGAYTFLKDKDRVARRIEVVLEIFPVLRKRFHQRSGSMSGGEQQMIAVAKALLPEPRLLIIDELSLGLAPVVVQRLLEVIASIKAAGTTLLVVEQSLNVASAFADRALFMEKGEIRFSGQMDELMAEGDLVRAVFLGER